MSLSLLQPVVSLPPSALPPFAIGFMGLGTGYLIYGPQELFGYPKRDASVNFATGMWGIWLPGLMQLIAGTYLFAGLVLFRTFDGAAIFTAALAFTSYGVHWFGIGWNRLHGADPRANVGMTVGFTILSVLGIVAFFETTPSDPPVAGLFIGLTCIYISDFFASLQRDIGRPGVLGERALGFFHLGTGGWLMYLLWADVLNATGKFNLPL